MQFQLELICDAVVLLQVVARLGKEINDESSVCYWCWKNGIPIFCPALTDGSLGDMLFFHSYKSPGLIIDIVDDIRQMNDAALKAAPRKTGIIILGGRRVGTTPACIRVESLRGLLCQRNIALQGLQAAVTQWTSANGHSFSACSHDMRVVSSQQWAWRMAFWHHILPHHGVREPHVPCRCGKAPHLQCQPDEEWSRLCSIHKHGSRV